tara:strand:- start:19 stop:765 length:747 start_codon:yes stop_codon:yes gene_type:complete
MILITRPKEDNDKLSILLSKKNIEHRKENLTSIRILRKKIDFRQNKIFLISSKQAVRSLVSKKNIDVISKSSFLVIGDKVKKDLIKINAKNIIAFAKDSESLLRKIKLNKKLVGRSLEYLCSNVYNKQFVEELKKFGFKFSLNQVYETVPKGTLKKSTSVALLGGKIDAVVFFSIFTFRTFITLCRQQGINKTYLNKLIYIAFSERIAQEIKKSNFHVKSVKLSSVNEIIQLLVRYQASINNSKIAKK